MKISPHARLALLSLGLGTTLLASCKPEQNTVSTPPPVNAIDTIFIPGADDKLHAKKVSVFALDTQMKSGKPAAALDEIIKKAPKWFPAGTHVEDVKDDGKIVTILMSSEFGDEKHWSKGETTTELAIYALVNSIAKNGKKVALTIEGKPITSLGEFDASDPIEADPTLNAKK